MNQGCCGESMVVNQGMPMPHFVTILCDKQGIFGDWAGEMQRKG